ncbi:hypothetical protein TNCT_410871 [Trichonephila clavata]|uniref:Uncharacterized protein n=1 Tax=Trichonephila clavata TaxID=2740835 RepID=A0A8X6J6P7_TRICU|nr:hypothetical protein TNCT_410871 [Trichonephila clavata]
MIVNLDTFPSGISMVFGPRNISPIIFTITWNGSLRFSNTRERWADQKGQKSELFQTGRRNRGLWHTTPHSTLCCAFKTNLWPAVLSFDAGRPQSISTVREYLFTVSLESFLRRLVRRFPFIYFYVSMRTFTLAPVKRCLISTNPAVELLRKFDLSR